MGPAFFDVAGRVAFSQVGNRCAFDLLRAMTFQFGSRSRMFWESSEDLPYSYGEAQLHSVMVPALMDVCEVVLREQPVRRRKQRKSNPQRGHGHVDYWLQRRERITLLELKHKHLNAKSAQLSAEAKREWDVCLQQVESIVQTGGPDLLTEGFRADVIGLFAITHKYGGAPTASVPTGFDGLLAKHNRLIAELDDTRPARVVHWNALWYAPQDMHTDNDWDETYLGVSFFATLARTQA